MKGSCVARPTKFNVKNNFMSRCNLCGDFPEKHGEIAVVVELQYSMGISGFCSRCIKKMAYVLHQGIIPPKVDITVVAHKEGQQKNQSDI